MFHRILLVGIFLLFSSALKSEEMRDLTKEDIYVRSGFETSWLTQLPKKHIGLNSKEFIASNDKWLKIPATKVGGRALTVKSIYAHLNQQSLSNLNPNASHKTFTFITSFELSQNINKTNKFLGLFMTTIGDNWAVYLNGRLIRKEVYLDDEGNISKHRFMRDILIQLDPNLLNQGTNILAFKIVGAINYEATGFYSNQSYLIGDYETLSNKRTNLPSVVVSFTYLILGIFFIFMYASRPKGLYNLMFGLSCLTLFVYLYSRTVLIQDYIIDSLIVTKIEYTGVYLFSTFAIIFFDLILGHKVSKASKLFFAYIITLTVITIFSDAIMSDKILRLWQVTNLFVFVYILFYRLLIDSIHQFKSYQHLYVKKQPALRFIFKFKELLLDSIVGNLLIGTLVVVITSMIDIFNSLSEGSGNIVQYGFFIFMASNTAVLIHKFVVAQTKAEELSSNLEQKVKLRTSSLTKANQKLEILNDTSKKMLADLVLARDEAKKSNNAKGEFLANMSHEIRTPINGVIGMLNMLQDTPLTDKQKEYSGIAAASANSLLRIINDILDFSKIEAGKLDLESNLFDLQKMLNQFSKSFNFELEEKGICFTLDLASDLPQYLNGDINRLKQILLNLTGNAKKFTAAGSITLKVETLKKNDTHTKIKFSLTDTGIGLSEEQQQSLFNKFTQADKSTTRKYGGTGLGLAISKQLTEAMNGEIGVISSEGAGSEFWFTCEFKNPSQDQIQALSNQKTPSQEKQISQSNPINCHVLVAEDNKINQIVIRGILNKFGISMDIAENGLEAIQKLKQQEYKLIFMDLHMPEMDGITATKKIRKGDAGDKNKDITIIAATANAMKGDLDECLSSGMNDYLSKPILLDDMERVLTKWIS